MLNFDSLMPFVTKANAMFQMLAVSIDIKLMAFGFDLAAVIMRGPTSVVISLAFSAAAFIIRRVQYHAAHLFVLIVE